MVKYKTEVYTKYHAWTSYNNLTPEQAKAIQDSCYDEIPDKVETYLGVVKLYNKWEEFLPINEAYENPGKIWSHNKKSDWYTHVETGLKVKKTKTAQTTAPASAPSPPKQPVATIPPSQTVATPPPI